MIVLLLLLVKMIYFVNCIRPVLQFPLAITYENTTTTVDFILYKEEIIENVVNRYCADYGLVDSYHRILEHSLSALKLNYNYYQHYELVKLVLSQMSDVKKYDLLHDEDKYGMKTEDAIGESTAVTNDSDEVFLYIDKSSIDNAGNGVFAFKTIPNNTILCEYRGQVVDKVAWNRLPYSDKFAVIYVKNESYHILGQGLCSTINDCFNTIELLQSNASLMEERNHHGQCYKGLTHNSTPVQIGKKLFYIAIREILPGEELFVNYGFSFWKNRYKYLKEYSSKGVHSSIN